MSYSSKPSRVALTVKGLNGLTGWQPLEVGHHDLDDETPAGLQVCGDILETGDLLVLGRQVHDRVEDQIGHRETLLDGGCSKVADGDADVGCAGFRSQLRDHRLRQIDAMDADTALCER